MLLSGTGLPMRSYGSATDTRPSAQATNRVGGTGSSFGKDTCDGHHRYETFYRRRFRPAAEAIGRPTLRFHDLRHTAASLWAASGTPLEMVAAALGHADTGVTYSTCLHFFPWARYMAGVDAFLAAPDAEVTPLHRAAN